MNVSTRRDRGAGKSEEEEEEEDREPDTDTDAMPRDATPSFCRIARSAIHGWGVFAETRIRANECIGMYSGQHLTKQQLDDKYGPGDDTLAPYALRVGGDAYLDAVDGHGNWTRFLNDAHGVQGVAPNCVFGAGGSVWTTRAVAAGEELLVSYGPGFWAEGEERAEENRATSDE